MLINSFLSIYSLDIGPLKCRAKDGAGKSKGVKARKTNDDVQKMEKLIASLRQWHTERFKLLDSSCFWRLRSSGRAVEKVLFQETLKHGVSIRYKARSAD